MIFCLLSNLVRAEFSDEALSKAPVSENLQSILKEFTFVAGDKSWSGGYQNNFVGGATIDANSVYCVFHGVGAPAKAIDIAKQVRAGIVTLYSLPVEDKPSGTWEKRNPPGISDADFAVAYANSVVAYFGRNQSLVISVQVVHINPTDIGVTVSYTVVE